MKRTSRAFLLPTLYASLVAGQVADNRITTDLVFEYFFDQALCRDGDDFEATAGTFDPGDAVTLLDEVNNLDTFSCTSYEKGDFLFEAASNGFFSNDLTVDGEDVTVMGVKTSNALDTDTISLLQNLTTDATLEFWLQIDNPPSSGDEVVLFELTRSLDDDEAPETWQFGTDYGFRLSLSDDAGFELEITALGENGGTSSLNFDLGDTDLEGLHHIVLQKVGEIDTFTFTCLVDDEVITSDSSGVVLTLEDFTTVVIGGTPELFLGNTEALTGAVHLFALYEGVVDLEDNFDAGPGNSLPVVATNAIHDHDEDSVSEIDFAALIFDFDADIRLIDDDIEVTVEVLPSDGTIILDGDDQDDTFEFEVGTDTITYEQEEDDVDSINDTITVLPSNGNAASEGVSAEIILRYIEVNDDPVAIDSEFSVSENQDVTAFLASQEPVDANDGTEVEETHFPVSATIEEINDDFGFFFDCDDEDTELVEGDTLSDPERDDDFFNFTICYRSDLQDDVTDDALIGTDSLTFFVTDGEGADSESATLTINVLNPLSSGCLNEDSDDACISVEAERLTVGNSTEDAYEINLIGTDSKCIDEGVNEDICADRIKEFIIIEPIPDPDTEGVLKMFNSNGQLVEITEGETTVLDAADDTIFFFPVENYFNFHSSPICILDRGSGDAKGECASSGATVDSSGVIDLELVPTEQFDSSDDVTGIAFNDQVFFFGTCNTDGIAKTNNGCPITIHYDMVIGGGRSPAVSDPQHVIWVRNTLESADVSTYVTGAAFFGPFNPDLDSLLTSDEDDIIKLVDPDGDAKNNEVEFAIQNSAGTFDIDTDLFTSDEFAEDQQFFVVLSDLVGGGFESFDMVGAQSMLNKLIANLRVRLDGLDTEDTGTLEVTLSAPAGGTAEDSQTFTFVLQGEALGDGDDDEAEFYERPEFYAIAATAGLILMLCCYGCCMRAAKTGFAVWAFGRFVLRENRRDSDVKGKRDYEEDSSEMERRRRAKCSYKLGVMFYIIGGPFCLALVCPCLWAYKEEFGDDESEASEEEQPQKKEPIDEQDLKNWEVRETEKNGRTVVYYYHSVTHKRQWHSPFPEDQVKEKKKLKKANKKGAADKGKKVLRFKLYTASSKPALTTKKESDDEEEEQPVPSAVRSKPKPPLASQRKPQAPSGATPRMKPKPPPPRNAQQRHRVDTHSLSETI